MKLKTVLGTSAIIFVLSISTMYSVLPVSGEEIIECEPQIFNLHGGQAWAYGSKECLETPTFEFSSSKNGVFTLMAKPKWISYVWTYDALGLSGKAPNEVGEYTIWVKLWNGSGTASVFPLTLNVTSPSFENPPMVNIVEGQKVEYRPTTNIPSAELSMKPHEEPKNEWIKFEDGILTGIAGSPDEYSATLNARTTEGPLQTATQEIKIKVYETLKITSVSETELIATQTPYCYIPDANFESDFLFSELPEGAVDHFGTIRWVPTTPGDYTFTVTAKSTEGPTQTVTQTINITVYPALSFSSLPEADMIVVTQENSFAFYSMSKHATSVLWDFGDGNTSTDFYPEHSYSQPGKYTVKLTAYNDIGESTTEREINIVVSDTDEDEDSSWLPLISIIALAVVVIAIIRYFTPLR